MKICKQCQKEFETKSKQKLFCSTECKNRSYYKPYTCQVCSKVFESKHPNRKYCSNKCSASTRVKKVTLSCEQCFTTFERKAYKAKNSSGKNFCSMGCSRVYMKENTGEKSYKWAHETRNCETCKEEVTRQASGFRDMTFCSRECYAFWLSENKTGEDSPSWRGGADPHRGILWGDIAEQIRERDGYVCTDCGSRQLERKHDVHHIIPWRFFDDIEKANDPENLITLCRSCHAKQEAHWWEEVPSELKHKVESGYRLTP